MTRNANLRVDCHVIAVKPSYQRRKAGTAIVEWQKELVDQLGLPMYLESSPTTFGFYEKMGFETLKDKIVHKASVIGADADIEVPLMVRMPSGAVGITFSEWRLQTQRTAK